MKVINTWDGEPKRTPTQIISDWYAEYRDDIQECGIDGFHATELMAALAPLFAAGKWRTDVENSPLGEWVMTRDARPFSEWRKGKRDGNVWTGSDYNPMDTPIAFATINQPEIEK